MNISNYIFGANAHKNVKCYPTISENLRMCYLRFRSKKCVYRCSALEGGYGHEVPGCVPTVVTSDADLL